MVARLVSNVHLPIVARELRVAARRAGTYWGRVGAAMAALALVAWAVLTSGPTLGLAAARAGRSTFLTIAAVALFSSMMTALRLTAPSIAAEKRDGTLGLLFLTDLRPRDIVLGKLAVSSLTTFFQFLAAVPALAIPILLGGVTAGDFVRLVLVLLNLMLLASAVGMCASTLSRDERGASSLATILILLVLGAGPAMSLVWWWWGAPPELIVAGLMLSPGYACQPQLGLDSPGFWVSFGLSHAAVWGFLGLTCWLLPRVWRDWPPSAPEAGRQERWKDLTQGTRLDRLTARRELLGVNPILWLSARDRTTQWHPWFFLAAVAVILVWARIQFNAHLTEPGLVLGLFWMVHAIFKAWVASQSAFALSSDRDRGALELVLSTPLSTGELVRGHWLGLRRVFAAPVAFVLVAEVFWVSIALASADNRFGESLLTWMFASVANLILFGFDLWAAVWVGLWAGVISRNGNDATGHTQIRLFWLPWVGLMVLQAFATTSFGSPVRFPVLAVAWMVFGILVDLFYAGRARARLASDLRSAAMVRASGQTVAAGWRAWLMAWARKMGAQP